MTIREWLPGAQTRLREAGIESASMEAQLMAAHVLLVDRTWLFAHSDEPFPELAGEVLLQRRVAGEPLAYLLGWREFFGRRFEIGPGALIPRHDTETVVEGVLDFCRDAQLDSPRILDLCTGSGCIGISLKLELPDAQVVMSDISESALGWARRNAERLGADVEIVESDGFSTLGEGQFDVIASNPPYIGLGEVLPVEVREFEPKMALYAGVTGLEFYDRIAKEGRFIVAPHGRIFLEVGYTQANDVVQLFVAQGWRFVNVLPDLAGIPRVVICEANEWT